MKEEGEETSDLSESVTYEIDCPLPTPFIDTPENNLITDCANEFTVTGGFEGGSSGATETLILYRQGDPNTEVGRTSTFGEDGSWSIQLDPNVVGEGELILVTQGVQNEGEGEETSDLSESVTYEIDCPLPTPFIDTPENNLITDCANEFTVTGGFEGGSSGATETLILYRQGDPNTEVGRTSTFGEDGLSWSISTRSQCCR